MKNNVNSDIQCFIIWKNARSKEEQILDLIKQDFDILKIYHVNWSPDKFGENLSAFYGDNFIYDRMQRNIRGEGEFVLVLTATKVPEYQIRETNRGPVSVNVKSFDLKQKIRNELLGNFSFHASNNMEETRHAVVLILGKSLQDLCATETFDGKIRVINQDVPCVRGYKDLREFFYVLNETCNYVVLRGFDALPDTHTYEKNGDIDLLVDDMKKFLALVNPKIRTDLNAFQFFNWENMGKGNPNLLIHPKFVGDNYYDINMQKKILETRVLNKNGIYVPSDDMYFWSLLHHGVFHKENWQKYDEIFKQIAPKIGVKYKANKEYLCRLMTNYMRKNGYVVGKHLDNRAASLIKKNIKNKKILKKQNVFYIYQNMYSCTVFHEKAIFDNPELVTEAISLYDIFIDLERHQLNKKTPLYRYVNKAFKHKKEVFWKFCNRMQDVSCLSYRPETGFNRTFLSGNKKSENDTFIYTEERNIPYINGKNFNLKLLEEYVNNGEKSFLNELDRFIQTLFDTFQKKQIPALLDGIAWDMLPKNCFEKDGELIFFDKEAICKYPLSKSLMLANIFLDFGRRFWFSRDERYQFYRHFIKKYKLPDEFDAAEQRRISECNSVLIDNSIDFDKKLCLVLVPRYIRVIRKHIFRLASHIYGEQRAKPYKEKYLVMRALCSKRSPINAKKQVYRLLSHITFGKLHNYYREKYKYYCGAFVSEPTTKYICPEKVGIYDEDGVPFCPNGLITNIKGENNIIIIDRSNHFHANNKLFVTINGSNNTIRIGKENWIYGNVVLNIGGDERHRVNNCKVVIGDYNNFSAVTYTTVNSGVSLVIGNDCMFSSDVQLYNTDGHPIYNLGQKNEPINKVYEMKIGNHVWVGWGAILLKNVTIPDGCIVGRNSLVASKKLTQKHAVIAGNPAVVIKTNIDWEKYDEKYVKNN